MPSRGRHRGGSRGSSSSSSASSHHFRAFQGVGNVLGSDSNAHIPSQTGPGAAYWARGFGRAGELTMQGQNAVGFDYANLQRPKNRGIGTGATSSSSATVSNTTSPRGSGAQSPAPAHLEGVPNTFAKSPFSKGRKVREPEYPAYFTSRGHDAVVRAPETSGDDRYLAGVRRGNAAQLLRNKKPGTSGWRSGDPAERAALFAPVAFVKATGEWKEGQWTGKDTADDKDHTQHDVASRPAGAGLGFNKAANTWHAPDTTQKASQTRQPLANEDDDEVAALLAQFPGSRELIDPTESSFADDPHAQPTWSTDFVGAQSQQPPHDGHHDEPALVPSALELVDGQGSADVDETAVDAMNEGDEPTEKHDEGGESPQNDGDAHNQDASDDDEEEIFIPYKPASAAQGKQGPVTMTQSDSEEERQLDAVIAEAGQQAQATPQPTQPAFVFDFTGDDSTETAATTAEAAMTTSTAPFVLGEEVMPVEEAAKQPAGHSDAQADEAYANIIVDTSDDDEGGFVPIGGKAQPPRLKGQGRKARNAAKKARRRAKKLGQRQDADTGDADPATRKPERLEPRMGDSDLEWGSDGPPDMGQHKANHGIDPAAFQLRELSLSAQADAPRNRADEERMLQEALAISASQAQGVAAPPRGVQYSSISIKAKPRGKRGLSRRELEQEAVMADYLENVLRQPHDSESEVLSEGADEARLSEPTNLDAMLKFMQGMDPNGAGRQMTLGDIEDEKRMAEEEAWMTEIEGEGDDDGDDSDSDSEGGWRTKKLRTRGTGRDEADAQMEAALDEAERQEIGESDGGDDTPSSSSDNDDSDDEEEDSDDGNDDEACEDADSDDDDDVDDSDGNEGRVFDRKFTWAAEDEGIINKIECFAAANHDVLTGRDRKARNRLFKSIETGEFDTPCIDDEDEDFINPDEIMGLVPAKRGKDKKAAAKKARGKAPLFSPDDIFGEDLQLQWEKDRANKAENKRKRAELRRAAAQNPFPNTHKKGTKKMAKKAARAERRAARGAMGRVRGYDALGEWDEDTGTPSSRGKGGKSSGSLTPYDYSGSGSGRGSAPLAPELTRHATNLSQVNRQILAFLDEGSHGTLALPPMDKRSRAQVHMLANAYSLTSKSRGAGRARFITLIKNKHSGKRVDTRKVSGILSGRGEASFGGAGGAGKSGKFKSSSSSGGAAAGGGAGTFLPPNKDGSAVGFGADRIGADNVGHRLLTMMGWAEGSGVGANQEGMAEPVGATIKTSKGGLGF